MSLFPWQLLIAVIYIIFGIFEYDPKLILAIIFIIIMSLLLQILSLSTQVIDPEKSQVKVMGSKVEINLKKAEPGSWSALEL